MKNKCILTAAVLILIVFGGQAFAQITITIPKIPKVKKPKTTPTDTSTMTTNDNSQSGNGSSATIEDKKDGPPYEDLDPRISLFLDELAKAKKDVDKYNSNDYLYLVNSTGAEWLWRAVSVKERAEFEEKWKSVMTPGAKKRFDEGFAALAASAAAKLPAYKSSIAIYSFHNVGEEKLMKGVLSKITDYKIFSVGLQESAWLIDKNDYGLPTARYKHGVVYLRDTKSDHPYCYATYINIKQDYAGGGTYGASYARFIEDEMVGCPAGAK